LLGKTTYHKSKCDDYSSSSLLPNGIAEKNPEEMKSNSKLLHAI